MGRVHDGKGKDAVQALYKVRAVFHVACQYDLRVAGGLEGISRGHKLLAQFIGIVQFPVVDNGKGLSGA